MKGLVWALYLMIQEPGAATTSLAFTGVTYRNEPACVSDAATFTKMPPGSQTGGADLKLNVAYVCLLQPKPGHY